MKVSSFVVLLCTLNSSLVGLAGATSLEKSDEAGLNLLEANGQAPKTTSTPDTRIDDNSMDLGVRTPAEKREEWEIPRPPFSVTSGGFKPTLSSTGLSKTALSSSVPVTKTTQSVNASKVTPSVKTTSVKPTSSAKASAIKATSIKSPSSARPSISKASSVKPTSSAKATSAKATSAKVTSVKTTSGKPTSAVKPSSARATSVKSTSAVKPSSIKASSGKPTSAAKPTSSKAKASPTKASKPKVSPTKASKPKVSPTKASKPKVSHTKASKPKVSHTKPSKPPTAKPNRKVKGHRRDQSSDVVSVPGNRNPIPAVEALPQRLHSRHWTLSKRADVKVDTGGIGFAPQGTAIFTEGLLSCTGILVKDGNGNTVLAHVAPHRPEDAQLPNTAPMTTYVQQFAVLQQEIQQRLTGDLWFYVSIPGAKVDAPWATQVADDLIDRIKAAYFQSNSNKLFRIKRKDDIESTEGGNKVRTYVKATLKAAQGQQTFGGEWMRTIWTKDWSLVSFDKPIQGQGNTHTTTNWSNDRDP